MRVNHKQKIILILVSVFMLLLNIMTSASVYYREKNLKAEDLNADIRFMDIVGMGTL